LGTADVRREHRKLARPHRRRVGVGVGHAHVDGAVVREFVGRRRGMTITSSRANPTADEPADGARSASAISTSARNMQSTRVCAAAGIAASIIWVIGFFFVAGFVPPPSPLRSAQEVAAQFADHTLGIRIGLALTALGGALVGLWVAAISVFLKRIEGRD